MDTYVTWEFPFPKDVPVVDKTGVVKDNNNPEYDSTFKIVINPRDKVLVLHKTHTKTNFKRYNINSCQYVTSSLSYNHLDYLHQAFSRVVKRGGVKLEVWMKGGFFRSCPAPPP